MGITGAHDGMLLTPDLIYLEGGDSVAEQDITASPRVGVGNAGEDALLSWCLRTKGSSWTSPAK